jgi:hypothetical protein
VTGLLFATLLAATATTPDVAVGPFNFVDIKPELREFIVSHVAQRFTVEGFTVITQRDLEATLGLERQRQLLGCSDETSCTAEILAALGASTLLVGDVAHVGGAFQVNLKLVDTRTSKPKAVASQRVDSERELLGALEAVVHQVVTQLRATSSPQPGSTVVTGPAPSTEPPAFRRRTLGWLLGGVGLAVTAAGGVFWGLSATDAATLRKATPTNTLDVEAALRVANEGANFQRTGQLMLGAGGAALVAGVLLWLTDRDAPAVALVPTQSGFSASLSGHF